MCIRDSIHAQLRRSNASMVGEKLSFSDIELDSESHKVFRGGSEIKLGPTEYRLLSFLWKNLVEFEPEISFWIVFGAVTFMLIAGQ